MKCKHWFINLLESFFCEKIYINLLQYIRNHQETYGNTDDKPNMMVIKGALKSDFGYSEDIIDKAAANMVNSGCLNKQLKSSNIFITEKGKNFLEDYYQFARKGVSAKFTEIFNKSLTAIVSCLSLIISIVTVIFKK